MNDMLNTALVAGTGRRAAILQHPAAGKTGTTQDYRDAWFVGYTAHLACGVWIGNDQATSMNNVRGGSLPAMIWHDIMSTAHQGRAVVALPGTFMPEMPSQPANSAVPRSPIQLRSRYLPWHAATQPYKPPAPLGGYDREAAAQVPDEEAIKRSRTFAFPRFAPAGMMSLGQRVP